MKCWCQFLVVGSLCAALQVPAPFVYGHHLWLNATRYNVEELSGSSSGGKTTVYIGWGDFYPVHDFLKPGQLKRLSFQPPTGEVKELTPGEGGFQATPIDFPSKGTYRVAAELNATYVTEIVEDGMVRVVQKPRDELPKNAKIIECKFRMQSAKAIINIGDIDPKDQATSAPVGHDLEIIPLKNPIHLREGDYLPFKILFKGSPLQSPRASPEIKAMYLGFSTGKGVFAWSGEMDRDGIVKLKLMRSGIWQIHVVHSQEPSPEMVKRADKYTVIRSVTTMNKPGDHAQAPLYWLTGNPRLTTGSDEYPMYGSVVNQLRPGPADLPTFVVLDEIDVHTHNALSRNFLGSAHAPFVMQPLKDKDAVTKMLTPRLDLPAFAKNTELLKKLDTRLRRHDAQDELITGLDQYQQTAFNLLTSPKLRQALDLSKEPAESVERFTRHKPEKARYPIGDPLHFLLARRLIEAGVPVVHFNLGYWDWHGDNFTAGKQQIPMFDACFAALLDDLDDRGLLATTIVLALGEMGRKPKIDKPKETGAGRDRWDYAQFVIAAGGGFNRGCMVGATDKLGEQVTDKFYKIESFGRTLYYLFGIDADTLVYTPANRPVKLIVEDAPIIREAIS